jgi:LAO/AO transport system kinase
LVALLRTNRRQLARLLTRAENHQAEAELAILHPFTGNAHLIGVTGAPGTGKSTLVSALARQYRQLGRSIAILAVDPTSPFSGGAILGDRIRMRDLAGDTGVFIRSMATRGSLGGLARTTGDVVRVFDAAGFDLILIETVGAGQSEVDIAGMAHTTLVVDAPGMGDDVQAIKAGILEIADLLVVNKADRPGAENTVRALRAMLDLGHRTEQIAHHGRLYAIDATPDRSSVADAASLPDEATSWQPPVLQTVAANGQGIAELVTQIAAHRTYLQQTGLLAVRERARVETELLDELQRALIARFFTQVDRATFTAAINQIARREIALSAALSQLLSRTET